MSEDNKNDDWGMTMPHQRLDDKVKESIEKFDSKPIETPNVPPADDWSMTAPNVNIPANAVPPTEPPPSFDKTTPNINIPPLNAPPADDWGMTQTNVQLPKKNRDTDWQMPNPVFRVSSGETPSFDKTTPNINLQQGQNENFGGESESVGGHTTPYYRLPENQEVSASGVEPSASAEPSAVQSSVPKPSAPAKSGNMKWILLLLGMFGFFTVATVAVVGVYFVWFSGSSEVKSITPNANITKSETTSANKTETSATPQTVATSTSTDLPATLNYKGEMVLVAGGEFTMGSDAGGDESKPAHKVTVEAFYIDKYEVTNAQYKEFCDATQKSYPTAQYWDKDYFEKRPNAPVLGVSFDDAKAYAEWAGKRLPNEKEWEKAASWDEKTKTKFEFPWGNDFGSGKAAFSLASPSDVGKYPAGASPSGAMDMAGNAVEWVEEYFQAYPGSSASNPEFGQTNRVVRGGHFFSKANDSLRTTKRIYVLPGFVPEEEKASYIGFRCAVSANDSRIQDALRK